MILVLAAAVAAEPLPDRRAAEALETALQPAEAALAWQACAESGSPRDRGPCAAAAARLSPHAADRYAGWTVLHRVRRDYRSMGSAAARLQVQAELDHNPNGPAALELRRWLVAEALSHGETSPQAEALVSASEADAAWVEEGSARVNRDARHRAIGLSGTALAALYALVATWGRPRVVPSWRAGAWAAVSLGLAPAALATLWSVDNVLPMLQNAAWVAVAVLLAPRAPVWLGVLGTLGGLAGLAWQRGWLVQLGVP